MGTEEPHATEAGNVSTYLTCCLCAAVGRMVPARPRSFQRRQVWFPTVWRVWRQRQSTTPVLAGDSQLTSLGLLSLEPHQ